MHQGGAAAGLTSESLYRCFWSHPPASSISRSLALSPQVTPSRAHPEFHAFSPLS